MRLKYKAGHEIGGVKEGSPGIGIRARKGANGDINERLTRELVRTAQQQRGTGGEHSANEGAERNRR